MLGWPWGISLGGVLPLRKTGAQFWERWHGLFTWAVMVCGRLGYDVMTVARCVCGMGLCRHDFPTSGNFFL